MIDWTLITLITERFGLRFFFRASKRNFVSGKDKNFRMETIYNYNLSREKIFWRHWENVRNKKKGKGRQNSDTLSGNIVNEISVFDTLNFCISTSRFYIFFFYYRTKISEIKVYLIQLCYHHKLRLQDSSLKL